MADRLLVVEIGGGLYGLDAAMVTKVLPVPAITPLPRAPLVIAGAANVRGGVVPVLNLKPVLGSADESSAEEILVMVEHEKRGVGLLADRVIGLIATGEVREAPATGAPSARRYLRAAVVDVLGPIFVFDIRAYLQETAGRVWETEAA